MLELGPHSQAQADPDGLSWTLLVPGLSTDTPVAALPGLLEKGAGWRQAQEQGSPGLLAD